MGGGKDFFAGYGVHTFGVQVPIAGAEREERHHRRLVVRRPAQGHDPLDLGRAQLRRLDPGQPPRQPARQRGHHPDRPQGPVERAPAVAGGSLPSSTTTSRSSPRSSTSCTSWMLRRPIVTTSSRCCSPASRSSTSRVARLAEVLRLNLTIPVTKNPNRMAVLAGDNQGWPNGRRLGDDVIDIAEQAVGGFLKGTKLPARRRRQRRRPEPPRILPVHRGSAERIRQHEGQVGGRPLADRLSRRARADGPSPSRRRGEACLALEPLDRISEPRP